MLDPQIAATTATEQEWPQGPLLPQPTPSTLEADLPLGVRTILRISGVSGLARIGGTAHTPAERTAFRLTLAVSRLDRVDIGHTRHTAVIVPRQGDNFGHAYRAVRMLFVVEGEVTVSAGGRTVRIGPGGGALLHGWDEYVYESTSDVSRVHVDLAADEPPFAAALRDVPALVWGQDTPVLRAAGAALAEVVRRDTGEARAVERDALRRLVQAILLSVLAAPPRGGVPAPARQRHRTQVLAYIAEHHASNDLTLLSVAEGLGMSKRSLQRLFESEAMGVAEHIAAARLEHALALLRDPYIDLPMEEVAALSGFGSVPRMRRAVRLATGMCPSDVRERSAAGVRVAAGAARG
ncbi:helix-turn-helix domain-containing protein [Xylanimonas allomyrinae]|uniref:Helix-turn-helix domain-containing protein n=1 Tax=Xylanimonas allomyrinae TaxID=2509459 RepID=A0A4P6ERL5_9MICO|nr:helix-turn-helix transcriptional regulator [Xylanimonas allomyrinae]QAY63017.1 helix-turn-helix domain-containing protein [Xylanimonas allomyrinae]